MIKFGIAFILAGLLMIGVRWYRSRSASHEVGGEVRIEWVVDLKEGETADVKIVGAGGGGVDHGLNHPMEEFKGTVAAPGGAGRKPVEADRKRSEAWCANDFIKHK